MLKIMLKIMPKIMLKIMLKNRRYKINKYFIIFSKKYLLILKNRKKFKKNTFYQ